MFPVTDVITESQTEDKGGVIPAVKIEIKSVDDSSGFLGDYDSRRCGAGAIDRFANVRGEEGGIMGENVVESGEINAGAVRGQGLKGGCAANGCVVVLWDDPEQMGGNVRWPILFVGMKVHIRSVSDDKVWDATVTFGGDSVDDD